MRALMHPTPATARLHAQLCASDSATEVIGALYGRPVRVRRLPCDPPPLNPARHACLGLTAAEPALHRRVMLLAAGRAVSEADLWYVPARLWPGMAETLCGTDVPFGLVVRAMAPRRQTLATRFCQAGEPYVLEHEALLLAGGRAIALVVERYLAEKEGLLF
jgi:chorismate-pyruvate lyase